MIINSISQALAVSLLLILTSCMTKEEEEPRKGRVVQVAVLDKDKLDAGGLDKKSRDKMHQETLIKKQEWYKMTDSSEQAKRYKEAPMSQLKSTLKSCSAEEATIILECLGQRGATAVPVIVDLLNDTRKIVFSNSTPMYSYCGNA